MYKAVMIATEPESGGVLFVKRVDSRQEARAALGSEILRLLRDFCGDVTISAGADVYDNAVLSVTYDEDGESKLKYTLCFDDEDQQEKNDG